MNSTRVLITVKTYPTLSTKYGDLDGPGTAILYSVQMMCVGHPTPAAFEFVGPPWVSTQGVFFLL